MSGVVRMDLGLKEQQGLRRAGEVPKSLQGNSTSLLCSAVAVAPEINITEIDNILVSGYSVFTILAYFNPKLKAKIDIFTTRMLINILVWTLQHTDFFFPMKLSKLPFNLGYFNKIEEIYPCRPKGPNRKNRKSVL